MSHRNSLPFIVIALSNRIAAQKFLLHKKLQTMNDVKIVDHPKETFFFSFDKDDTKAFLIKYREPYKNNKPTTALIFAQSTSDMFAGFSKMCETKLIISYIELDYEVIV